MVPSDFSHNEELVSLASTVRDGSAHHVGCDEPDALDGDSELPVLVIFALILTGEAEAAVPSVCRGNNLRIPRKVPDRS
jgi:hypothetical protein